MSQGRIKAKNLIANVWKMFFFLLEIAIAVDEHKQKVMNVEL